MSRRWVEHVLASPGVRCGRDKVEPGEPIAGLVGPGEVGVVEPKQLSRSPAVRNRLAAEVCHEWVARGDAGQKRVAQEILLLLTGELI